jgi:hypothetical protein
MMYLRWLVISVYALITTLAAMLLTPFVVPFASIDLGRMPWLFRWMETPDVLLPGDPHHVGTPVSILGWYWASMRWLWRNPAYRATDFAKFVPDDAKEGYVPFSVLCRPSIFHGDQLIAETPFKGGCFYAEMGDGLHKVFELYWLWKWPCCDRCIRLRLGWKLKAWFAGKKYVQTDVDGMHVLSFNLWMRCN